MTSQGRHSQPNAIEPIEKFLGSAVAGQGPFAILGLHPENATDEHIIKALEARLDQIANHAESGTPEADEVRLAVHAAAAQLLDPAVRKHLKTRTGRGPNATHAVSPSARLALEHDAIVTLGMFGGWNKKSLRRLTSLAHARGMSSAQLADALGNLAIRREGARKAAKAKAGDGQAKPQPSAQPQTSAQTQPSVQTQPEFVRSQYDAAGLRADPTSHRLGNWILIGGIIIVGMILLVVFVVLMTGGPTSTGVQADDQSSSEQGDGGASQSEVPFSDEPVTTNKPTQEQKSFPRQKTSNLPAFERIKAGLGIAIEGLGIDVLESQQKFSEAIDDLSVSWPDLADDELIAIHSEIIEFLYRSGNDASIVDPVQAIASGTYALEDDSSQLIPDDIPRAVWSVGMLTRLSRENDISASAVSLIEASLGAALGGGRPRIDPTFQSGAVAAISQLASKLAPTQDALSEPNISQIWNRWAQIVDRVSKDNPQQRAQLLLVGIESLLLSEVEPAQSKEVSASIALLVTKLTWRDDEGSRRWLLRWFNHRGISNDDMNAITSTLATKSAAPGVDLTMVLSTSASERVRTDLRYAYAKAWNMQSESQRQEVEAAWIRQARQAIEQSLNARSAMEQLAAAATNSRLSEAGRWLWKGESSETTAILSKGNGDIEDILNSAGDSKKATVLAVHDGDGRWAAEYLAAGHMIQVRLELLEKKSRDRNIDPVDAEVVAREAFYGSPREIQNRAKQIVRADSENPAMVNAMLELVPRVPRTKANSLLIEQVCLVTLCDVTLDQWPMQARRALVQVLIERLAAKGNLGVIDRLASIFADSYASRSQAQPLGPDSTYVPVPVAPEDSLLEIWNERMQTAQRLISSHNTRLTLDQIRRRRVARGSTVSGAAQLFAAEQTSLVELMAYIIAAENPEHADAVALALTAMAIQRRKAKTVFEQMNVTERAFLRLWLIRHGDRFS